MMGMKHNYSLYLAIFLLLFLIIATSSENKMIPNNGSFSISGSQTGKMTFGILSILSLNSWFPPLKLPNNEQAKRKLFLVDSLLKQNADIICLQEIYKKDILELLLAKSVKQYNSCKIEYARFGFSKVNKSGGLVILSKYPIINSSFHQYPKSKDFRLDERIASKGFLVANITFDGQVMVIINTHLYSGRNAKAERIRSDQIGYLFNYIDNELKLTKDKMVVLAGDFNITNPVLKSGKTGLIDSISYHVIIKDQQFIDPSAGKTDYYTYDCLHNRYAGLWYNKSENRQIFDYIFYRGFPEDYQATVNILFNTMPVSDHYGLLMEFNK